MKILYDDFLSLLVQRKGKWSKNLDHLEKLYFHLRLDQVSYKVIHVAGTNGKGSVCWKIAKALHAAGYSVGLFSSPHLFSYRERIQVDFLKISKKDCECIWGELESASKKFGIELSFFEMTTLTALMYFKSFLVDYVVLETGLGGRFDATNIVTPILSVITMIGLDHTHILGDTLEKIAFEKAGIIKKDVPLILGEKALFDSILTKAKEMSSKIVIADGDFLAFDDENSQIAKKAIAFLKPYLMNDKKVLQAMNTRPEYRFDMKSLKTGKTLITDVAHNPCGFRKNLQYLQKRFEACEMVLIIGLSQHKDTVAIFRELSQFDFPIMLFSSSQSDIQCPCKILTLLKLHDISVENIELLPSLAKAFEKADNCLEYKAIFVAGSFYFMKEAQKIFQNHI
ncbi:MAG TPA: Mur ligase family protein [Chlamydiales bacterium]|nr:Mur ligase family protein [Chlamydiales bacterium]